MFKKFDAIIFSIIFSLFLVQNVCAAELDSEAIYNEGVTTSNIDPSKYTLGAFKSNIDSLYTVYQDTVTAHMKPLGYTFDDFLKENKYGAFPNGQGLTAKNAVLFGQQENGNALRNVIQPGDILVIGACYTSSPIVGHAAIATTHNWILEMPGGGKAAALGAGIPDNNRQFSTTDWIFGGGGSTRRINNWIQVYRLPNRALANQVANWADAHFYNPSHGTARTIHMRYRLWGNQSMYTSYCSKLVLDAFWYGSGSANVVNSGDWNMHVNNLLAPNALISCFNPSYRPYLVGTY